MHPAPPTDLNLADWFLHARVREGRGDRVALRTDDGEFTYSAVHSLALRWARFLADTGVDTEQRVLLALPDSEHFVGAFFGAITRGSVVVMLNPDLKPDAITHQYNYTRATALVTDHAHAPVFLAAMGTARHVPRHVFVVDDLTTRERLENTPAEFETFPSHRDDAAVWLYSGGTTGEPKAVVQTHGSFVYTTLCYAHEVLGMRETDVTLSVPKLFFGYATGINLLFPFSVGATAALFTDRVTAEVLFDQIEKHRPTVLVNVPTMVNQMVSHPRAPTADLSSLRVATSAGEPLPVELYNRWKSIFGVELLDGLGTAEMWHVFLTNRIGSVKPGSLGRPVEGFEVRLTDDDGRDVARGDVGWLRVRGHARAQGYWQNLEKTSQAFQGEWYVSGDMLRQDADGDFFFCGRGDDMLKVAGRWLSPSEVEDCLQSHPSVQEVAVVGVTDEAGLTKPWAWVTPVQGTDRAGLDEALRTWASERLDGYKVPRRVVFLDAMPRTHLGKIDRGSLRRG